MLLLQSTTTSTKYPKYFFQSFLPSPFQPHTTPSRAPTLSPKFLPQNPNSPSDFTISLSFHALPVTLIHQVSIVYLSSEQCEIK